MRVLHVTPFFQEQYGGTERYCHNLCTELAKLGHDVEVYTARINSNTPLVSHTNGVRVRRFYTPTVVWSINPLSFMLHRLLQSDHDIIHVHSYLYFASNQAVLAKILRSITHRRTRLLLHLHGGIGSPIYLRSKPLKKVAKSVYDAVIGRAMVRVADRVLSADAAGAKAGAEILGIDPRRITIIHNGINLAECTKQRNQKGQQSHDILYVGDLERWKGIATLLEAMRILHSQGNGFNLKLLGDGTQRKRLQGLAHGLPVQFMGQVPHDEVLKLMSNAFAVALPSLWEGIPTVGLEAMATQTPFIGTNVGGIPELIENKVTGLLVPRENPAELAKAILRLEDHRLRQELTRNAFQRVQQQFDIAGIARQLERLYRIVLAS
jgi:glycosyltransferase involved in cell wall biosynthesis